MLMPIVTLLSDFGTADPYVAQMKGVILGICPNCQLVDITHDVARHDIVGGAFLLETSVPYFPKETVHLAVVDPGVGSKRLPVAIECEGAVLVGPDNGLLVPAARKLGLKSAYAVHRPVPDEVLVSQTFHGRDVLAVAAARLASGVRPAELGPRVERLVEVSTPTASLRNGSLNCHVQHIDRFGNIITNARNDSLSRLSLIHGRRVVLRCLAGDFPARVAKAYHEVPLGGLIVVRGSQGYLEVAVREKDAAATLELKPADKVQIRTA